MQGHLSQMMKQRRGDDGEMTRLDERWELDRIKMRRDDGKKEGERRKEG